jgi:hypothetical protein
MMHFSQPDEERLFNERHSQLLELLPSLNDTLDNVFKHTVMADRQGLTVFMLGRRCANDFSEILLLASNGYGFAALQILRSMFEKLVDARYLHEHPKEVDNFWDYHLVLLVKLGYQDVAQKFDAECEKKVAKFKTSGKKRKSTQPRWTKLTLVDEAKKVGLGDHLHGAYYLPNAFIHNSSAELLFALEADKNGRFTPLDFNNPKERRMADVAVHQGLLFLILILQLEVEHYGWEDSALEVQQFLDRFGSYLQSLNERKSLK